MGHPVGRCGYTLRMSFFWGSAALLCVSASSVLGQVVPPAITFDPNRLTVEAINRNPTGAPPRDAVWSPDGRLLTYLIARPGQGAGGVGEVGDLVAVEAATGKARVLATAAQLSSLGGAAVDEKDRDHRERYGMSAFFWAPDGKHLLLDQGGVLWLYDVAAGKGELIVDTHAGSGDDPKFSPDGRFVSYVRAHNLYVYPVKGGGAEVALTATTAGTEAGALLNGELDWVYLEELDARSNNFWAPDGSAVAYLQMDEAKVPQYPIEDFIPTHATLDRQRYPQPGDANPAVRVGVAPVGGGAMRWMNVPLSAGNDYVPRFGWVDAKTVWVEVLTRDHQHLNLYFGDASTGAVKLVHSETDAKYLEDNYDVTMLPHGRFLNTSWRDGHTHLYLYSFEEKAPLGGEAKLVRQLTKGDYEVDSPVVPSGGSGGEEVYFTSTEGGPLENGLWAMRLDGTGKRKVTGAKGWHEVMVSPDGGYFSDQVSTSDTAPVVRVCGTATGECKGIWSSAAMGVVGGVRHEIVALKAADGVTTVYGNLTMPSAVGAKGSVPVILNPYGGPVPTAEVKDGWGGQGALFSALLAQHGFAVLSLDGRGSGGRGRDFQQWDWHNFGAVQFADQMAALDQVLAGHPAFDGKRVGWWGWSWGGTFTLYAMTHTDRIRAGVAVAPVTDFRNYDSIYTERYLGLPGVNKEVYDAAAVGLAAGRLKGRVMIALGTGDDNVHMANTVQFLQPLINAGIPYDLQLFPRLTHSIAGDAARDELFNRILWQFESYLK